MSKSPFVPLSGKAQWEIVTEVLATKTIGDIVTDEELLGALGFDFSPESLSSVVWTAIRKYRDHKRTFERVRKIGWRMVAATEHSRLATRQQIRSRRRLKDAVDISASTDTTLLTEEQRRHHREQELSLRRMLDVVSRRVDKVESRVAVVEKVQASTDDEMSRLKSLLSRHGITDDE